MHQETNFNSIFTYPLTQYFSRTSSLLPRPTCRDIGAKTFGSSPSIHTTNTLGQTPIPIPSIHPSSSSSTVSLPTRLYQPFTLPLASETGISPSYLLVDQRRPCPSFPKTHFCRSQLLTCAVLQFCTLQTHPRSLNHNLRDQHNGNLNTGYIIFTNLLVYGRRRLQYCCIE